MDRPTTRRLGSYYTPEPYARALVEWALDGRPGSVLDPSFGGCAVLRVAIDQLRENGAADPASHIYGTDVDKATAVWASHLESQGVPSGNLLARDFLDLRAGRDIPRVAAVVGNPPYVRHHWIDGSTKTAGRRVAEELPLGVSRRASLWAYFVVHATSFVSRGGRLSLILPGAVLEADYAASVRKHLESTFRFVQLIRLSERLFPGAEEASVVLAADGAHLGPSISPTQVTAASGLAQLREALASGDLRRPPSTTDRGAWDLDDLCAEALNEALAHSAVSQLSDRAEVHLGCVTGANDFFVMTSEDVQHLGVEQYVVPAMTRNAWVLGPEMTAAAFRAVSDGLPNQLLRLPPDLAVDGRTRLGRYIGWGEEQGLPDRHHCQRDPWWSIPPSPVPSAFLPYMVGEPKGLALNRAGASSTNTVHQVTFAEESSINMRRSWAVGTWSTLAFAAAELIGRRCGGGVLKLELGDARRLPMMEGLVGSDDDWRRLRRPRGQTTIDELVAERLGLTPAHMSLIRNARAALRQTRRGDRTDRSGQAEASYTLRD
jgi:adenine-specific DNA-methyltransferase